MAKVSAMFGAKFLSADSFDKQGKLYEILDVKEDKVGQDIKLIAELGKDVGEDSDFLPLNRTNALTLSDAFGDDTDDWRGKHINVYRDMTMYNGKRVPCLRVRTSAPNAQRQDIGSGSGSGSGSSKPV